MTLGNTKIEVIKKILVFYIILQPILDMLTTLSIAYISSSVTIGIVTRVIFMLLAFVFILLNKNNPLYKYIISYILATSIVLGISFVFNFFTKPVFSIFAEAQFTAKTLYLTILLCAYLCIIFTDTNRMKETRNRIYKGIVLAMLIVSVSLFIAILTGTSTNTYDYLKGGYKGWYYAGNELGAIVAICFPIVYLTAVEQTMLSKKCFYWIVALLLAVTGLLIGTKVGFFAILGSAIIGLASLFISWAVNIKKNGVKNKYTVNMLISIIFIGIYVGVTAITPAYSNFQSDAERYSQVGQENNEEEQTKEEADSEESQEDPTEQPDDENGVNEANYLADKLNVILSSRSIYFGDFLNYYQDADVMQKVFGMGYAGNYTDQPKLIEMDFFDLFFSYGIIGFSLLMLPYFIIIILIFINLVKHFKQTIKLENVMLLTSLGLAAGIALLAGHVFYAPGVSIYLALTTALLFYNLVNKSKL